ncbi:trypsin-like serine peptidase [Longispora albida]|uniref:trypsin-like serine peptidase n=1 Tax=Longispora albida TaxID=203523 RepID=UPI000363A59F|nr:serine protease [Longispora albida]
MKLSRILAAVTLAAALGGWATGPAAAAIPASPSAPAPDTAPEPQARMIGEELTASVAVLYTSDRQSRQEIRHPGAAYVKVHFSQLRLAPGDYVTVSNPAGTEVHTYHGKRTDGDADHTQHGRAGFGAMSIDGDVAVITLHATGKRSADQLTKRGYGAFTDGYWRGYSEEEIIANNPSPRSVCATDARRNVVCYQTSFPTEYSRSRAVAKLLIGGGGSCTTWRVGSTNRLLTNKHCFSTQAQVASSEVQFNYQCTTCTGTTAGAGTKVSGSTLIKVSPGSSSQLDYTLYSVNNFANIGSFGYLVLETTASATGQRIYIPGHGDGSPKRLSIYEDTQGGTQCTIKNANINTYNISYSCDTSGGNSGSPVLNANHKVVALHHLGGCPNNQGAKIHLIYNDIKNDIVNS